MRIEAKDVWKRDRQTATATELQPLSRGSGSGSRAGDSSRRSPMRTGSGTGGRGPRQQLMRTSRRRNSTSRHNIDHDEEDNDEDSEDDDDEDEDWESDWSSSSEHLGPDSFQRGSWLVRLKHVVSLHSAGSPKGSYGWYGVKWAVPAACFASSFYIQNVLLHIATYFYIEWMYRLEESLSSRASEDLSTSDVLSSKIGEGSLHDMSASILGWHNINMAAIDGITISLPCLWFALVVWRLDLHLFTKCTVCGSFLALGKGMLSVLTVVPDSIGWAACKVRLGEDGVKWFEDPDHVNFSKDPWNSLLHMAEITAVPPGNTGILRFCADMLYSGHTYFVALFALGVYDGTRPFFRNSRFHSCFRVLMGTMLCLVVFTDATLILLNKFHYTIDIVLALMVVFLYYTNAAIARAVVWWADEVWVPKGKRIVLKQTLGPFGSGYGEILIPPCFFPFCLISGRYTIQNNTDESYMHHAIFMYLTHLAQTEPHRFVDRLKEVQNFHADRSLDFPGKLTEEQLAVLSSRIADLEKDLLEMHEDGTLTFANLMENTEVIHNGSPLICEKLNELLSAVFQRGRVSTPYPEGV
mmetsp:Transcript_34141/g.72608  ORF Transcript_34141/g.72608 Transcript_34141/m.72608 type:complete len:581 (+) Transcript_34141:232-1974(+)